MSRWFRRCCVLTTLATLTVAGAAQAGPMLGSSMTYRGYDEDGRAASALFNLSGSTLQITLSSTSTQDVLVPDEVLTALFFNVENSSPLFTPGNVMLTAGSTVFYDPDGQPAGDNISGEWAYRSGLSGPGSTAFGISSVGLGLFGPGDRFDTSPASNLAGPANPNGLQYGLLSLGDNPATGNGGITGSEGLAWNSVLITLSGVGSDFDLNDITDVYFQYGTDLSEPGFFGSAKPPIDDDVLAPEPASAIMLLGGIGLIFARRPRKTRPA